MKLTSLQHTLNSLMQHNFRLIQLLLDLHDTIRRSGILILHNILLEHWKRHLRITIRPTTSWKLAQKLIQYLAQQLMRDERRVLVVADDDARHALAARVGMEGVRLLFDVLTLAGPGPFGDCFAE